MKSYLQIIGSLAILVFLYAYAPSAISQDLTQDETQNEAPASSAETQAESDLSEDTVAPASQEVDVNEDNYRQFMELKDARRWRGVFPETAFKPQTSNQKLDKLPEESQRHLRNQLREIIVQSDAWKPGDEDIEYPYTPSDAASSKPSLQKLEAEAWAELVEGYHHREAEIYANSARSDGAAARAGNAGGGTGDSQGSAGVGSNEGSSDQQAGQQDDSSRSGTPGSYAPNSANDSNARSTAGVSQNAMEFLKNNSTSAESAESSEASPSAPKRNTNASVKQESAQNALEFLMGEKTKTTSDQVQSSSSDIEEGTISIEDLLNVQGVRDSSTPVLPAPAAGEQEDSSVNAVDKDG